MSSCSYLVGYIGLSFDIVNRVRKHNTFGFYPESILTKGVVYLDIDLVKNFEYDSSSGKQNEAFKDLVIRKDHKTIVKALVANHSRGLTLVDSDAMADRQIDLI